MRGAEREECGETGKGGEERGERRKEREGKKSKLFYVLEVAVHSDFSCSFCILLSWWPTHSCSNILLLSLAVPTSSEGFDTGLSTFQLMIT